jgi:hypothetical protein
MPLPGPKLLNSDMDFDHETRHLGPFSGSRGTGLLGVRLGQLSWSEPRISRRSLAHTAKQPDSAGLSAPYALPQTRESTRHLHRSEEVFAGRYDAPPAGFEPAHTAPEWTPLCTPDLRKRTYSWFLGGRMGDGPVQGRSPRWTGAPGPLARGPGDTGRQHPRGGPACYRPGPAFTR